MSHLQCIKFKSTNQQPERRNDVTDPATDSVVPYEVQSSTGGNKRAWFISLVEQHFSVHWLFFQNLFVESSLFEEAVCSVEVTKSLFSSYVDPLCRTVYVVLGVGILIKKK